MEDQEEDEPYGPTPISSSVTVAGVLAALPAGEPEGSTGFISDGSELCLSPKVQASVPSSSLLRHGVQPALWLIGHTYIYRAEKQATLRPGGRSLGFTEADVHWRGIWGLRWMQVLAFVLSVSRRNPYVPTVLVVHARGNDLSCIPLTDLLILITSDIDRFLSSLRNVVLVWSKVVPRTFWQGARDNNAVEKKQGGTSIQGFPVLLGRGKE